MTTHFTHFDALTALLSETQIERKPTTYNGDLADAYAAIICHEQEFIDNEIDKPDTPEDQCCLYCKEPHRDHDNVLQCHAAMSFRVETLEQLVAELSRRPNGWLYRMNDALWREVRRLKEMCGEPLDEAFYLSPNEAPRKPKKVVAIDQASLFAEAA